MGNKIGTFNGIDFYEFFEDIVVPKGKKIITDDRGFGRKAIIETSNFNDDTGELITLKNKVLGAYESALSKIPPKVGNIMKENKPLDYVVITSSFNKVMKENVATMVLPNGGCKITNLSNVKEGYTFSQGVIMVPYTIQLLEDDSELNESDKMK